MAIAEPITTARGAASRRPALGRDTAVDLARAACLLIVVGLHSMMAGITLGPAGIQVTNALEGHPLFAAATWIVQVMPLFFVLGGFASLSQWRRWDGTSGEYILSRVLRLARPAVLLVAVVGGALAASAVLGVDAELLREVGFRVAQPLWFLGVYLGCSALIPLMVRLHDAAPHLTLAALLAGAVTVDIASDAAPGLGYLNFLFVWLFVQQLGFWLAEGRFASLSRRTLLSVAGGAFATMGVLVLGFGYSADMFVNLNPPTLCILLLGIAQVAIFAALRPWLREKSAQPRVAAASAAINRHSMTVYLWHLPAIVLVGLGFVTLGLELPSPLGAEWWQSRPMWLVAVGFACVPIALLVARYERSRPRLAGSPGVARAAASTVLAILGVLVLLAVGFSPAWSAAASALLFLAALRLSARRVEPAKAAASTGPNAYGDPALIK